MLYELVKLVHIHVHKQLRGELAERQPNAGRHFETAYDPREEPNNVVVWYVLLQDANQPTVLNRREKPANIAFEHPRRSCVILGDSEREVPEPVDRLVHPLLRPARIQAVDECPIEER